VQKVASVSPDVNFIHIYKLSRNKFLSSQLVKYILAWWKTRFSSTEVIDKFCEEAVYDCVECMTKNSDSNYNKRSSKLNAASTSSKAFFEQGRRRV